MGSSGSKMRPASATTSRFRRRAADDHRVPEPHLVEERRTRPGCRGCLDVGQGVRAQLNVVVAEHIPREDHVGPSHCLDAGLVRIGKRCVADDRQSDPLGSEHPERLDQLFDTGLRLESSDPEDVAPGLESEALERRGRKAGTDVRAIRDVCRLGPVLAFETLLDGAVVGHDDICRGRRTALGDAEIGFCQPSPLVPSRVGAIDVEDDGGPADARDPCERGVPGPTDKHHVVALGEAVQDAERGVADGVEVLRVEAGQRD